MSVSQTTKITGYPETKERRKPPRDFSISTIKGQEIGHVLRVRAIRRKVTSQKEEVAGLDKIPKKFRKLGLEVLDKVATEDGEEKEFMKENPNFIDDLRVNLAFMCTRWEEKIRQERDGTILTCDSDSSMKVSRRKIDADGNVVGREEHKISINDDDSVVTKQKKLIQMETELDAQYSWLHSLRRTITADINDWTLVMSIMAPSETVKEFGKKLDGIAIPNAKLN